MSVVSLYWPDMAGSAILAVFKGASTSVQVLCTGIEAVMVLTLIILTWRALYWSYPGCKSCLES